MKITKSLLSQAVRVAIVTSLILIVSIVAYMMWETHQHKDIVKIARAERENMADRIWKAKTENFQNTVRDNSAWDELVDFADGKADCDADSAWLNDNFGYMLDSYNASMVAIYNLDGEVLYSKVQAGYEDFDFFSMDFDKLSGSFKDNGLCNFYIYKNDVLMEFFGATITNSADNNHKRPPHGFLLLSREITNDVLEDYRISLGALYIGVSAKDSVFNGNRSDSGVFNIVVSKRLSNYYHGHEVYMCSVFENTVEAFFARMKPFFALFAFMCALAMGGIVLFLSHAVMKPLSHISKSLKANNPSEIQALKQSPNEFGLVAKLLDDFYLQQEEVRVQNETLRQQSDEILAINEDLNDQKDRLATANLQLTDSISYAGRIQHSAVTQLEVVTELFPDSMVIYRPREILSGDWYYVAAHQGKKVVVEADCTGHGVPGSLLSMLGISSLKDILNAMDLHNEAIRPEIVLDKMRDTVKSTLIQDANDIMSMSDGMDMSIGVWDDGSRIFKFACANQSMLILHNGAIIRKRGNRMPVGNYVKEVPFVGEEVQLSRGDAFFFMSDGIKDQTNPQMEKFRESHVEEFIIENSSLPMAQIGSKLIQAITEWQDDYEQVDDMTMIGIRV